MDDFQDNKQCTDNNEQQYINDKIANKRTLISLILMFTPTIISVIALSMYSIYSKSYNIELDISSTAMEIYACIIVLFKIASVILIIDTRIRYPKNIASKVVMWVYIVLVIIYVILTILAIVACIVLLNTCIMSLQGCGNIG
jgi:cytochrome bd-type quinol oxidase subunit 2